MKKIILLAMIAVFSFSNSFAQLPDGSVAPDFTLTDLNGTSHSLYSYLDQGYTVFIDFSAVWCPPCWSYHQTHALEDLYVDHGCFYINKTIWFIIKIKINLCCKIS